MFVYGIFSIVITLTTALLADTEVVVLRAVRGRDARLPCGQGKVFLDGPDSYVLWLKNDRDFLYRFPNEESERRAITRDRIFGTSCVSGTCYDDTSLLLKHIGDHEGGVYRCRVHYQASPSFDYIIEVRLVGLCQGPGMAMMLHPNTLSNGTKLAEPWMYELYLSHLFADSPGQPKIFNGQGEEITKSFVGPLSLGFDLTLVCEVDDDQPDTLVYWRRNGVVIERAQSARPGILRAEVNVRNATRDELDAHYECLAQNADVTEPLTASVVIKMYLAPLSVEIRLNNNFDFEAGQPRVVDCVVVGCVPPPSITWHLGETMLRPTVHKELHDGNYTVSSLTLAPSLRDSKRELVCRAHNSHEPKVVFEDKVVLNVGYRPICLTTREETIGAIESEAETITCMVEGSPEPLQFSWTFADSKTLYTSVKKVPGHHHRYSSTLTWLPREGDIGLLLCRATNTFGEQKRPCTFTVSPGGPPQAPECILLRSSSALRVQCKKAWDGGRPQTVHLELFDEDGTVLHNISDPAGHFQLPSVEEDRNLTALAYATSTRGRSEVITMHLKTLKPLSAPVIENAPMPPWARWLEAAAGTIVVGVGFGAIAFFIKVLKGRRDNSELNPDLVPRSDGEELDFGSFHREPDFAREERALGTTNITVNQLATCQNQYSSTPVPSCRVLVGCAGHTAPQDPCLAAQHSYYV